MRDFISNSLRITAISLIICCSSNFVVNAQTIEGLVVYPDDVESLQENSTNFDDPLYNGNGINVPGAAETENNFTLPESKLQYGISAEVGFSSLSKYLNVPLSIGYKGFNFTVAIPFYIQKKAKYRDGSEYKYVAAYGGLGDISAELSYRLQYTKIFNCISFATSFPTGNQNRTVKGYIVPMGTGSFDFIFSNTFQYRHAYFRVYNNISYRLSGKCERNLTYLVPYGNEMVNYVTSNGNFFSCNTSFDYPVLSFMSLHAGLAVMNSSAGTIYSKHTYSWKEEVNEFPTAKLNPEKSQAYTSIDVRAAVAFSYWGIDLMCVFAQPVYVKTENPSIKESQKFNFYIKLSKKIF